MDVNAIDLTGVADPETGPSTWRSPPPTTSSGSRRPAPVDWSADPGVEPMLAYLETKTVWHPKGI